MVTLLRFTKTGKAMDQHGRLTIKILLRLKAMEVQDFFLWSFSLENLILQRRNLKVFVASLKLKVVEVRFKLPELVFCLFRHPVLKENKQKCLEMRNVL